MYSQPVYTATSRWLCISNSTSLYIVDQLSIERKRHHQLSIDQKPHHAQWNVKQKQTPFAFESQTEISLPEYCKVEIRQNVLTADITTHPFDWWYDGNIFKDVFSNVTELLESIQRIVWQRSNFGLSGLKHFKHSYEKVFYSVDAIWDKIMSLDFINWLDTLSIIVFACLALIFLCIVHTNGWHKKLYECFQGK